jgi:hypothetical protein
MLKTVLIVFGVFIGMGATWLTDPVPVGMEVRDGEGALIGRVASVVRDEHGKLLAVTVASSQRTARFQERDASRRQSADGGEQGDDASEEDALRRRSISLESFFRALPIWE